MFAIKVLDMYKQTDEKRLVLFDENEKSKLLFAKSMVEVEVKKLSFN